MLGTRRMRRVREVTRWAGRIAALVAVTFVVWRIVAGLGSEVLFEAPSDFGQVRVTEDANGVRSLYIGPGRARQTAVIPGRPRHLVSPYARVAMAGLGLVPSDARILFVGLGGGAMPMFTRQAMPRARIDVVEINPVVVDVARTYFDVRQDVYLRVHTADGRAFIEAKPPGSYDLIVLDAFSDDEIPRDLATLEFLQAVRSALAPDGVVVSNLWSTADEYESMLATYEAAFADVQLVHVDGTIQNILLATPGSRPLDEEALLDAARELTGRAALGFDPAALVRDGYIGPPDVDAPVLRDLRPARSASDR